MNLDQIKANAPSGATHYRLWKNGEVDYIKMSCRDVYDSWFKEKWVTLPYAYFSYPLKIKPL